MSHSFNISLFNMWDCSLNRRLVLHTYLYFYYTCTYIFTTPGPIFYYTSPEFSRNYPVFFLLHVYLYFYYTLPIFLLHTYIYFYYRCPVTWQIPMAAGVRSLGSPGMTSFPVLKRPHPCSRGGQKLSSGNLGGGRIKNKKKIWQTHKAFPAGNA